MGTKTAASGHLNSGTLCISTVAQIIVNPIFASSFHEFGLIATFSLTWPVSIAIDLQLTQNCCLSIRNHLDFPRSCRN
jgi:hypothetical protein